MKMNECMHICTHMPVLPWYLHVGACRSLHGCRESTGTCHVSKLQISKRTTSRSTTRRSRSLHVVSFLHMYDELKGISLEGGNNTCRILVFLLLHRQVLTVPVHSLHVPVDLGLTCTWGRSTGIYYVPAAYPCILLLEIEHVTDRLNI